MTGLATGLGLAITVIGIPVLTLLFADGAPAARGRASDVERAARQRDPVRAAGPERRRLAGPAEGLLDRLGHLARDPLPAPALPDRHGHVHFAVATYGTALYLIAAPVAAPFDGIELGIWEPNTVLEGLALVPLGATVLLASGWISEGMAAMSRSLARWGAR